DLADGRMRCDHVFDLLRHDARGAGADHVLEAADNGETPIAVECSDVTGTQPVVAQSVARGLLVLPIAGHHVVALYQHLPGCIIGIRAVNPYAIGWERVSNGFDELRAIASSKLRRSQIAADGRLGHAVEHADARADEIECALEHRGGNARAAHIDRFQLW